MSDPVIPPASRRRRALPWVRLPEKKKARCQPLDRERGLQVALRQALIVTLVTAAVLVL
jgi:hypothetical protein